MTLSLERVQHNARQTGLNVITVEDPLRYSPASTIASQNSSDSVSNQQAPSGFRATAEPRLLLFGETDCPQLSVSEYFLSHLLVPAFIDGFLPRSP
jgi:hypothetical protein